MNFFKWRSVFLLLVVLVIILVNPLADGASHTVRVVLSLLWIVLTGVGGSLIASTFRWWKFFGAAVVFGLIAFTVTSSYPDVSIAVAAGHLSQLLINGLTLIVILRFSLLNSEADPIDRVLASICGYLVLGVLWAAIYEIAMAFDPMAIVGMGEAAVSSVDLMYFSLVTLSTLGYGDLLAQNDFVRLLAALEAVAGVLYSAVLIAALVAELRVHSASEK